MRLLSPFRFTLVTLGGALMIASTFLLWTRLGDGVVFGPLDRLETLERTGWEHEPGLAAVFVVLGVLLLALALLGPRRRLSRRIDVRVAVLVVAAAIAVVVLGFVRELSSFDAPGTALVATAAAGPGPWVALAGAALALLGLALPPKGTGTS